MHCLISLYVTTRQLCSSRATNITRSSAPASSCEVDEHSEVDAEATTTHLVHARQHVRHADDGVAVLVDLVEDIVAEELDDIPVARL